MSEMTFVLQRNEGDAEVFPLGKYGGEARFAWGEPGHRAAIWKVVARPDGEVYVVERVLGSALKISLHKSGDWRFAWIERGNGLAPKAAAVIGEDGDRLIDQWSRPLTESSGNFVPAYTIFTTGVDLTRTEDDPALLRKVLWMPAPGQDEIAFFNIGFMRPGGGPVHMRGHLPIFAAAMKTGEALLVTAVRRPFKDDERKDLAARRAAVNARVDDLSSEDKADVGEGMRVLTHGQNVDGGRWALDLALNPLAESDR